MKLLSTIFLLLISSLVNAHEPDSLRSGDIIMVRSSHKRAQFIHALQSVRDSTQSAYFNHSGLLYKGIDGWYVAEIGFQQNLSGVKRSLNATFVLVSLENYLTGEFELKFITPKDPVNDTVFEQALFKYLGTDYDYRSMLLHQPLYKLTGIWIGSKGKQGDKMICNELTMAVWNDLRGYFPEWSKGDIRDIFYSYYFTKIKNVKNEQREFQKSSL